MEFSQKKFEIGFLIFITAFTAPFLCISFKYTWIARLIPAITCMVTLVLVAVRFVQIFMTRQSSKTVKITPKVLIFTLALLSYLGITYLIGFMISTTLFVALVMWFLDYKKLFIILCITTSYVTLMYFLFIKVFNVALPKSLIGF